MSDTVVPAGWVADRLDNLQVVDVRDAWEYEGIGHLPGAVNIPFDSFRGEGPAGRGGESSGDGATVADAEARYAETAGDGSRTGEAGHLPGAAVFAELMREAGVSNDDEVVAYDDTHGVFAARFLVTAELYGHDPAKLHLLDGDFSAWHREREIAPEPVDPQPAEYLADFDESGPLVDMDAVREAVEADAVVVDVREPWEYDEGHLPGAVQLDWRELVDDETRRLLPEVELREILEDRGIVPDRRVVLYCNTARRISHTYLVLRHLGYGDVAFYEGSLTEWEARGGELA